MPDRLGIIDRSDDTLAGGCFCGAVRYRIVLPPIDVGYCHCRMCRRVHGAPVVAWVSVEPDRFGFTAGTPRRHRSSGGAVRQFCGDCGTPVAFRPDPLQAFVDVPVTTLDDPEAMPPQYHIWTQSRLSWFDTADSLPRHDDNGPDQRVPSPGQES